MECLHSTLEPRPNVPTYTYSCTSCNDIIEKRQSFSDAPLTTCEQCGGTLRKIIHPVGIVFKGSGWYVTDSRAKSSTATSSSPSTADAAAPGEGSKSTETAATPKPSKTEGPKEPSTTTKPAPSSN